MFEQDLNILHQQISEMEKLIASNLAVKNAIESSSNPKPELIQKNQNTTILLNNLETVLRREYHNFMQQLEQQLQLGNLSQDDFERIKDEVTNRFIGLQMVGDMNILGK